MPAQRTANPRRGRRGSLAAANASSQAAGARPGGAAHIAVALLLACLAAAGYGNALSNGFVWDDNQQILQNPLLKPGAPWSRLLASDVWAYVHPGRLARGNDYRPLQTLTYKLTIWAFGFSPTAFHAENLALHIIATVLVYFVMIGLCRQVAMSAAAGALFALHPVHTEAVDWISALPELGCAVFFLLSVLFIILASRERPDGGLTRTTDRRAFLLLSCASFAIALLWKEMALGLPLIVGLYAVLFCPSDCTAGERIRRAAGAVWPYVAVLSGYLVLRYAVLGFLQVSQRRFVLGAPAYALTAIKLIAQYWAMLVLPIHLNAYHVFHPVRALSDPRALGAIAFVAAAVAFCLYGYRKWPLAVFGTGWIFLTLIPVLDLRDLGRNVFAERYLYIPSAGFCLLVVWFAREVSAQVPRPWRGRLAGLALVLVGVGYWAQTTSRNQDWKDQFTLFTRTLQASPGAAGIENGVADLLRSEKNEPQAAQSHYLHALGQAREGNPPESDQVAAADRGLALIASDRGATDAALNYLAEARRADPDDPEIDKVRGAVLLQAGRWGEARDAFLATLKTDPDDANALNGMGFVAWQFDHNPRLAANYFRRALDSDPPSMSFLASLHDNLGDVLCAMARCQEGAGHLRSAVELAPMNPAFHTDWAYALAALGESAQARAELEKALLIAPDYGPARAALGQEALN